MARAILIFLLFNTTVFGAVFGDITVEGNTRTATNVILANISFSTGDQFTNEAVNQSWEKLEDLNWFTFVDMDFEIDGDKTFVTITVEEDNTFRIWPLVDYDRRHDILLGLRMYDFNFRGKGDYLGLKTSWYAAHRYDLQWHHPLWLDNNNLTLSATLFYDSADFVFEDYDYTQTRFSASVKYDLHHNCYVSTEVGVGSYEISAQEKRDRFDVSFTAGYDTRDIASYPTSGSYCRAIGQSIDSDGNTLTVTADFRQFLPTFGKNVFALRAWGRLANDSLQPEDWLYWGGSDNLRGYKYASKRGEEGFILSAEFRIPLFLMTITGNDKVIGCGLHFFVDNGNTWEKDKPKGSPLYSYGTGVHLAIADQQFRFEIAETEDGKTIFQFMDTFNF